MKKIKLRAWDKENKCMIYSNEVYPKSKYKFEFEVFNNFDMTLMEMVDRETVYREEGEETWIEHFLPVDAEIMQYTELKDQNGKEIYEGDIVKIEDYFGEDIVGKVVYDKVTAAYVFYKGNKTNYFQMSLDLENYVFYIIGNVYENPELLKYQKKSI